MRVDCASAAYIRFEILVAKSLIGNYGILENLAPPDRINKAVQEEAKIMGKTNVLVCKAIVSALEKSCGIIGIRALSVRARLFV